MAPQQFENFFNFIAMNTFIKVVQALALILGVLILCAFFYMMLLVAEGQMKAEAQQVTPWPASYDEDEGVGDGGDNPFAAYESCQSPRQQAYMREHQKRLDAESRK